MASAQDHLCIRLNARSCWNARLQACPMVRFLHLAQQQHLRFPRFETLQNVNESDGCPVAPRNDSRQMCIYGHFMKDWILPGKVQSSPHVLFLPSFSCSLRTCSVLLTGVVFLCARSVRVCLAAVTSRASMRLNRKKRQSALHVTENDYGFRLKQKPRRHQL